MNANDFGVSITYRDKDLHPLYEKTYTLQEYTEMMRSDLLRLVTDIEDLCYAANDNKSKDEWTDETFTLFNKIKHKLLDKAGDIGRLPMNLTVWKKESLSGFVAQVLNGGG